MADLIRRLATSQARGERQLSFVNELLSFEPVKYEYFIIPSYARSGGRFFAETPLYGVSRLEYRSWKNLRKRLVAAGFVVEDDKSKKTVQLHFFR